MLQLAAGLDKSRYQPLIVFTRNGPILEFAKRFSVPTRVVPMLSHFSYSAQVKLSGRMLFGFLRNYIGTIRQAEELAGAFRPDLVHLNTSVLLPIGKGMKSTGIPIIWHVREVAGMSRVLSKWINGRIQEVASHIVVNSAYVARDYIGGKPVTVVHNALEGSEFSPRSSTQKDAARQELGLPLDASVVGIIGGVQEVKGHFQLVDAARRVVRTQPKVKFLVVAGGVGETYGKTLKGRLKRVLGRPIDNMEALKRLVTRSGLADRFVFSGYRQDMPFVISAMDVLTHPPILPEGFGRPLIEGMAMECPIVATDIGPTREIVGDTAILVRPDDPANLAQGILEALTDERKACKMAKAGRTRFLQRFEMHRMRNEMQAIYEQVLGRHSQAVEVQA